MVIAYGVAVGNWERYHSFVAPRIPAGRPVTVQHGHPSITVAYNHILDSWSSWDGLDALVLLHEDLEMIDPDTESKIMGVLADQEVAFVGVAGGRGVHSLAWWEASERFGHQLTDSGPLELGPHTGDVDSLEGSFLVFSPWAVKNLRYDERMTGFHCCDEIVIGARAYDKRAVVADIATHHHTIVGAFKSEAAQREWFLNDEIYRKREKL